jgi:hypothetical protein
VLGRYGPVIMARIRITRHEVVPKSGSYQVRFSDGRPTKLFDFDDVLQHLRPDMLTSEQALEQAKAFVRAERNKDGNEIRH